MKTPLAVDIPPILLPWMEPVQHEIRRNGLAQRNADHVRTLGFRIGSKTGPTV